MGISVLFDIRVASYVCQLSRGLLRLMIIVSWAQPDEISPFLILQLNPKSNQNRDMPPYVYMSIKFKFDFWFMYVSKANDTGRCIFLSHCLCWSWSSTFLLISNSNSTITTSSFLLLLLLLLLFRSSPNAKLLSKQTTFDYSF